jgi:hypothetical protein
MHHLLTTPVYKAYNITGISWSEIEELQKVFGHRMTVKYTYDLNPETDCVTIYPEDQETEIRLHEGMRMCPSHKKIYVSLLSL